MKNTKQALLLTLALIAGMYAAPAHAKECSTTTINLVMDQCDEYLNFQIGGGEIYTKVCINQNESFCADEKIAQADQVTAELNSFVDTTEHGFARTGLTENYPVQFFIGNTTNGSDADIADVFNILRESTFVEGGYTRTVTLDGHPEPSQTQTYEKRSLFFPQFSE